MLAEDVKLAITIERHLIELAFVVASGAFKKIARCFHAFSGVDICICVKSEKLPPLQHRVILIFPPTGGTSNRFRAQIDVRHLDSYNNLKVFIYMNQQWPGSFCNRY